MAPRHTRRPRSVTEQPPLTPVRVAAGARNHRWTSEPTEHQRAPDRRDRFRNPASRRQRCQPSERGVSSPGGTRRAGLPLVATRRAGRVIARSHHRWFGTLPLRCRCHRQSVARAIQLDGLPRRSYFDRPRPPGLVDHHPCPAPVGRKPSSTASGSPSKIDGASHRSDRETRAARSPHRLAGLPASVAARRGVHSSNDARSPAEQVQEAQHRIAVLRGLYGDLAEDLRHLERRRDLWAQVKTEQAALAELMPPVSEPLS